MRNLSAPTDSQMLQFQAWRATALQIMPYMASTLFSLRPVSTDLVETFGVDPGLRLYINFEECGRQGAQLCAEALLHECSHVLAEHAMLAETAGVTDEERTMWNVAGDMAINDDLRDAGCGALASYGVFAAKIGEEDYLTPLHYMDVLRRMRDARKSRQQASGGSGNGGQGAPGQPGQQPGGGDSQEDGQTVTRGCGSGAGAARGAHELDESDDLGGAAPAASAGEKALVRARTAAAVKQHQKQHGIGSVPGGITQIVEEILAPSVTPWQRTLASYIRRAVAFTVGQHQPTYNRRNRRNMNTIINNGLGQPAGRLITPGYIKPVPSVHFYRDTSGSMSSHDLATATNEVLGIARKLGIRGENLIVSDLDTEVHQSTRYSGLESIAEVQGRGGTDMGAAIRHACSLRNKPSVIVVATDGETGWPFERPTVPVVVLLINMRDQMWKDNVPDWAHVVEVTVK